MIASTITAIVRTLLNETKVKIRLEEVSCKP